MVPNSIMYRYYSDHVNTAPTVLSSDDISAATNRYGVKVHSHPTMLVPTISTSTLLAPGTSGSYGCNNAQTKTLHKFEGLLESVCSTLFELDNCRGRYIMTPIGTLKGTQLGNWENGVSSLKIPPNCRVQVCSVVDGNEICSADVGGTIPSLNVLLSNRIDKVSCACNDCSIRFPIQETDTNVCAVAYRGHNCRSTAEVFSPGDVWLRYFSGYWQNPYRDFVSAQVNPNCTVSFCHTETITNHTCLTLNGGVSGKSYPSFSSVASHWRFMRNVTTVHCSCLPQISQM